MDIQQSQRANEAISQSIEMVSNQKDASGINCATRLFADFQHPFTLFLVNQNQFSHQFKLTTR
jgi:hypothetical protein